MGSINTFQSQTLWIFSKGNQCLNQAWSVLLCSPGTFLVPDKNVGSCKINLLRYVITVTLLTDMNLAVGFEYIQGCPYSFCETPNQIPHSES